MRILANRTDMSKKDDSPDCECLYTFGSAKHGESVLLQEAYGMTACRQCAKHEESDVIIKETLYEQRSIICQDLRAGPQDRQGAGQLHREEKVKEAFA